MLGLNTDDPTEAGVEEGEYLPGYALINRERELLANADAIAASELAAFADSRQGVVATIVPSNGKLDLTGNIAGTSVQVTAAPTATVLAIHELPGRQQQLDRFALLPQAARQLILRLLPGSRK